MGAVQMALRRPADAVPFLVRARAKSPADPAIAIQLGLAYFAQEQYDEAQSILEEAFRSDPTVDGLGYYVGFMRYRKKD
jgi:predicted Zn-dependent protease